ncbi:MAG TPA: DUF4197 family protein, partial [Candidatus Sulfotelmatobacter sp.]|nr:DUF4197 family protein [Candidatus Sulfotelmatobacter sp.]
MKTSKTYFTLITALALSQHLACADLLDPMGLGSKSTTNQSAASSATLNALSEPQVVQGLKEALSKGVEQAICELGHEGGFLTNLAVRIPMPEKLQSVERTLRALRQDKLADD